MVNETSHPGAGTVDRAMDELVELSRHFGADTNFVIAGGGNTSLKTADQLYVKGSGTALASITPGGFVEMERAPLSILIDQDLGPIPDEREAKFKKAILAARIHPEKGQRPSVECVLHNMLPRRFVVHTHATEVNMMACSREGERLCAEILGDGILWMPYVDPGFTLARALKRALEVYAARTGRDCPPAVVMQNHGLIVCGETAAEVIEHTRWLLDRIGAFRKSLPAGEPFGSASRIASDRSRSLIHTLGPVLRALLADGERLKVVTFDDSDEVLRIAGSEQGKLAALDGPLTPDQIVYCTSYPLWFESLEQETPEALIPRLRGAIAQHKEKTGSAPLIVLVQGLGLFAVGDDFAQADAARLVYIDAIRVMGGARQMGGIRVMPDRERGFIEHWEAEAYRRNVAAAGRRGGQAIGLVAVVTGAAQGYGLEIALDLGAEGAHVAFCDINAAGAQTHADGLSARCGPGRGKACAMDVTRGGSIADALHEIVRSYGGFDLVISNAGVLRAGSVKTQPEREFDLVTAVNYKGYFLVVQNAAPVLALQHAARPEYWSDIIQINSKSGLAGSNRNGAYAGSKFGSVGLTQSFALELVQDGIKVNAVCPGNYFDGPLWADPETGLFVQYLRAGKVAGAKTIEDVRRFYEAKVPMGRGCTTADVMKAVYYLIAQKYETGQAVPVTGGQIMLS
jgi:rhamnose utilization protein RhaD (predicted bifunctional aldolase and dehydrogenase)/NAD(P)-dependent dehydrogenase (short-subunit alcohol dehydrogenase family)